MDKETFETWNKVALLYQEKFMDLDLYNESYDLICNSISKHNAKILDVGCGPGNITRYLLSKRPDLKIHGIDIAPNMIELAKRNNPAANFSVMDCQQINELNEKFDGIVCGFCLPYLSPSDCEKLIADACSLLNNDGLIYLSFVEGDPNASGFRVASTGDRSYFYYHSLHSLNVQLLTSGFIELKEFKVQYQNTETHTIVTARKGAAMR